MNTRAYNAGYATRTAGAAVAGAATTATKAIGDAVGSFWAGLTAKQVQPAAPVKTKRITKN